MKCLFISDRVTNNWLVGTSACEGKVWSLTIPGPSVIFSSRGKEVLVMVWVQMSTPFL